MSATPGIGFFGALRAVFATLAEYPGVCLSIGAPYAILIAVANAIARSSTGVLDPTIVSPGAVAAAGIAALLAILIVFAVNIFVLPVTLGALSLVGSAEIYGDAPATRGTIRRALDRGIEAVGTFVLMLLVVVAQLATIGMLAVVIALAASPSVGFGVLNIASVIALVPILYVTMRMSLSIPVVMREGRGPVDAVRRSWRLVHGRWWEVLALHTVGLAFFAFNVGFSFRSFIGPDVFGDFLVGGIVSGAAALVSAVFYGVASGIAYTRCAPDDVVSSEQQAHDMTDHPPSVQ